MFLGSKSGQFADLSDAEGFIVEIRFRAFDRFSKNEPVRGKPNLPLKHCGEVMWSDARDLGEDLNTEVARDIRRRVFHRTFKSGPRSDDLFVAGHTFTVRRPAW